MRGGGRGAEGEAAHPQAPSGPQVPFVEGLRLEVAS